ncbi:hypothetical protein Tco_1027914 [Tanacetum coccineum]
MNAREGPILKLYKALKDAIKPQAKLKHDKGKQKVVDVVPLKKKSQKQSNELHLYHGGLSDGVLEVFRESMRTLRRNVDVWEFSSCWGILKRVGAYETRSRGAGA